MTSTAVTSTAVTSTAVTSTAVKSSAHVTVLDSATSRWRLRWPLLGGDLTGADLDEAVTLAADPHIPDWALERLPTWHVAVLDTVMARDPFTRKDRTVVWQRLRAGPWMLFPRTRGDDAGTCEQWARRVAAAPWLTTYRFERVLRHVAQQLEQLPVMLPHLAGHRRFTRAAAGRLLDLVASWRGRDEQPQHVAVAALRGLGGHWDPCATLFAQAISAGAGSHGHRWGPMRRYSLEGVGRHAERLPADALVALAALISTGPPDADLSGYVKLAAAAGAPARRSRRRTAGTGPK